MLNGTTIGKKFAKTARGAVCLASALTFLIAPGISSAGSFTFDGINTAGDMYDNTKSFEAEWFNGHGTSSSNYQPGGGHMTTVLYGTGTDNAGDATVFSWLFLEVPLIAKNMVWGDGFGPTEQADYGKDSMDFGGATGSEKVVFGTALTKTSKDGKDKYEFENETVLDLAKSKDSTFYAPWNILDFRDSTDYLLGAGSAECGFADPATNCGASNRTMSFEVKLAQLLPADFTALKDAIVNNGLGFHLSPEEVGDHPPSIPVPAAFWLFGTALIGFIGYSRRTSLG